MITTYVYVLSYGRSGSTLLDWLLDAHSHIIGLGEIGRLPHCFFTPPPPPRFCACGARIEDCVLWGPLVESTRQLDMAAYSLEDYTARLMDRAQALKPSATVLVDSSGNAERLGAILRSNLPGAVDLKVLFLTRNVYGVVHSAAVKGYNRGEWRPSLLRATASWTVRNLQYMRAVRRLDQSAVKHLTYESLCSAPERTMQDIFAFLGLEDEDVALRWKDATHHTFAGNVGLRKATSREIRNDDAWERNLSSLQKLLIRSIAGYLNHRLTTR
jgi:hypothetical protein